MNSGGYDGLSGRSNMIQWDVYQIYNRWKWNTPEVTWDARFAWLQGPIHFKLAGGQGTAIAIRTSTLVEMMDRRNGATSATRTDHGEVAN